MNLSFLGCCFFFFQGLCWLQGVYSFFFCVFPPWNGKHHDNNLASLCFLHGGTHPEGLRVAPSCSYHLQPSVSKQKLFFLETQRLWKEVYFRRLQVAKGNLTLIDSKIWSPQYSKSWFICQAWARVKGTCWKPMFRLPSMEQIYSLPRHFWRWFSQAGVS